MTRRYLVLIAPALAGAQSKGTRSAQPASPSAVRKSQELPPSLRLKLPPPEGDLTLPPIPRRKSGGRPLQVGQQRPLPNDVRENGAWTTAGEGQRIWRVLIQSPGAASLRVHFKEFDAGAGKVWVHDGGTQGKPQAWGPYSGRGLHQDGDFWSNTVFGDTVIVEFLAGGTDTKVPFQIPEISHQWR